MWFFRVDHGAMSRRGQWNALKGLRETCGVLGQLSQSSLAGPMVSAQLPGG